MLTPGSTRASTQLRSSKSKKTRRRGNTTRGGTVTSSFPASQASCRVSFPPCCSHDEVARILFSLIFPDLCLEGQNLSSQKLSLIDHFRYIKIHTWLRGLGNKTKEMYYSLLNLKTSSFVLFPQASQPSINFNISGLVYCVRCEENAT